MLAKLNPVQLATALVINFSYNLLKDLLSVLRINNGLLFLIEMCDSKVTPDSKFYFITKVNLVENVSFFG